MEDKAKDKTECVQVVVRCRPLNKVELENSNTDVVLMDVDLGQVKVKSTSAEALNDPSLTSKAYTFDAVFPSTANQESVYARSASHIVEFVLQGFNGTIFAYGQTGTGKTHTMEGVLNNDDLKGMMPRSFDHIFTHIAQSQVDNPSSQFLVSCQFVEIYLEDVMDLLVDAPRNEARQKLQLKETGDGGIYVAGASKHVVKSSQELLSWLEQGKKHRVTGATKMNEGSSRSHCIFSVTVETSEVREDGQSHIRVGKLNLVDLAGSERQGKTGATGQRFKEATRINLSLTCLGQVISALTSPKSGVITYRNSKLTRLLQDSLGGNTKTVMIANIGPANYNHDETVETLRFAARAKLIKNRPTVNQDPKDAMLKQYQDEIEALKRALANADAIEGGDPATLAALGLDMGVREKVVEKVEMVGIAKEQIDQVEHEGSLRIQELQQRHANETAALKALNQELSSKSAFTKDQVDQRNRLLEQQRESKRQLANQLKDAESRLKLDKDALLDAQKNAEALEMRRIELEREEKIAKEKRKIMERQDEEFFASLQKSKKGEEDLGNTRKKLNRLQDKYKAIKSESVDILESINREREDLLDQMRELSRHIQFQDLLLQHFVPQEQSFMIEARAIWDDAKNMYVLKKFDFKASNKTEKRPPSLYNATVRGKGKDMLLQPAHRPVSLYEMDQRLQGNGTVRFTSSNIMQSALDSHERTTQDISDITSLEGEDDDQGYNPHSSGGYNGY